VWGKGVARGQGGDIGMSPLSFGRNKKMGIKMTIKMLLFYPFNLLLGLGTIAICQRGLKKG
jgi:hypothetical protein